MERVAECHCGQLRVVTSGEPNNVYVCHCKACQRRTGAVIQSSRRRGGPICALPGSLPGCEKKRSSWMRYSAGIAS
jgi:hypothetical protein